MFGNVQGIEMESLMWILGYTSLALIMAVCIGAAIIGGSDDDWDDRFR